MLSVQSFSILSTYSLHFSFFFTYLAIFFYLIAFFFSLPFHIFSTSLIFFLYFQIFLYLRTYFSTFSFLRLKSLKLARRNVVCDSEVMASCALSFPLPLVTNRDEKASEVCVGGCACVRACVFQSWLPTCHPA